MSDERTKDIHLQVCMKIAAERLVSIQFEDIGQYRKSLMQLTEAIFRDFEDLTAKLTGSIATQPAYQQPVQEAASRATGPADGTTPAQTSKYSCNKCEQPIKWHVDGDKKVPQNMDGTPHWDSCTGGDQKDPDGPDYNVGKGTCKKCQETIWWKKSKAGKSYPVNVDGEFHSGTCGQGATQAVPATTGQRTTPEPFDLDDEMPF